MSRDAAYTTFISKTVAGAAATYTHYFGVHTRFKFEGWGHMYEAAEGGTDNTITVAIAYTVDGSNYTTLKAVNSNTAGLLDSGAPNVLFRNRSNPGSAGATWSAESVPTAVDIPANAVIRVTFITAGTSPVAQQVIVYGHYLATV